MRLLKQPTDYSCGQTCVAMLANVKPQKVIAIVNEEYKGKKNWSWRGTSTRQLVRALKRLKVRSRRKLQRLKKHEILPDVCIVKLTFTGKRWGHWVVFKGLNVYDPWYGKNPKWPTGVHPTSYLEIL